MLRRSVRHPGDLSKRCRDMRERVWQWLGLPTCIGIGQTKTLAKLANHIANRRNASGQLPEHLTQVCHLGAMPKDELSSFWRDRGRGSLGRRPRIGQQLQEAGIRTVLDLSRLDPATVRNAGRWCWNARYANYKGHLH